MVDKKKPHGDYKLIVFYLKVDYYLLTYKTMEILMIYWVCYSDAALLTILLFSYRSTKIIDFLKADQNRLNFDHGLGMIFLALQSWCQSVEFLVSDQQYQADSNAL